MKEYKSIKVSLCYESDTNIRGKDFVDPKFNDFVASVREKGVLVPVIARIKPKGNKKFEIVAGNRRLRASIITKKESIKAVIKKLTDDEVKEIQIIENLQRLDVHPIDEGFGYRGLVEDSKYSVGDISIKVGKSKDYIRQRLFLTNLIENAVNYYRKGKIIDGHAVLIAKLSVNDQKKTMRYIKSGWQSLTVKELKEWIVGMFYKPLSSQPWLKNETLSQIVGECIECPPNRNSLFGKIKEGECVDLKCWGRKMGKYVKYQIAKSKKEGVKMLRVSRNYGVGRDKSILSRSDYESVSFKEKERCKYAQRAIVADDESGVGTLLWICVSEKCSEHRKQHAEYRLSLKEKEKRRVEAKKQKLIIIKEEERVVEALVSIRWPLNRATLDILFRLLVRGQGVTVLRPVAKRHNIEAKKVKRFDTNYYEWEDPILKAGKTMDNTEKLRFIVGVILQRAVWMENINKILKDLVKAGKK